jgi:hypothetical protein
VTGTTARSIRSRALLVLAALALARAGAATTILDLQPFEHTTTVPIGAPGRGGTATLIDLNPRINRWYVLAVEFGGAGGATYYHLENPAPRHQTVALDAATGRGIVVRSAAGERACELWSADAATVLERARRSGVSYAPLCDGRLYLRNSLAGYRTTLELVTEFVRDHVWGGERVIEIVKSLERDARFESSSAEPAGRGGHAPVGGPLAATMDSARDGPVPEGLGIEIETAKSGRLSFGEWYRAKIAHGIYVSVMQPDYVAESLLASHRNRVPELDDVEARANTYLVAFDLSAYSLGYEVGTEHPRVGWSERALPEVRDPGAAGPDGFDTIAPLAATGVVSPALLSRTVAAFTGGFKREHGAFRYGELAQKNHGSHYGWLSNGTLFSTLEPGLATLVVRESGAVDMETWRGGGAQDLEGIVHARQNGVPLVEPGAAMGEPVPGALVGQWSAGNWSGSASGAERTVRAGVCIQESAGKRFLVYGYFSSATPTAMVRVFQAYRCRYAMLLDMNALEHTYLALYSIAGSDVAVQHLVRGMEEVDRTKGGHTVPRFIGYPDNRDFFYVFARRQDEP